MTCSPASAKIGVIGDFQPRNETHTTIAESLEHTGISRRSRSRPKKYSGRVALVFRSLMLPAVRRAVWKEPRRHSHRSRERHSLSRYFLYGIEAVPDHRGIRWRGSGYAGWPHTVIVAAKNPSPSTTPGIRCCSFNTVAPDFNTTS